MKALGSIVMVSHLAHAAAQDRKIETRRIIVPQVHQPASLYHYCGEEYGDGWHYWRNSYEWERWQRRRCPYGKPGDRFIIKTTWATERKYDRRKPSRLPSFARIWFADELPVPEWVGKRRPARFLPKRFWSRRERYEVVSIGAENIQAITAAAVRAEGIRLPVAPNGDCSVALLLNISADPKPKCRMYDDTANATVDDFWIGTFAISWNEINGKRTASRGKNANGKLFPRVPCDWDADPWVWVIKFKRVNA